MFNANSAIFQLYHGENKLIIKEIMMTMLYIILITIIFSVCPIPTWLTPYFLLYNTADTYSNMADDIVLVYITITNT